MAKESMKAREVKRLKMVEKYAEKREKLKAEGFHQRVIDALALLSHAKEVSYDAYIRAIATNVDAILVKMSDLNHNSDIRRMKGEPCAKDYERNAKYRRSYHFLENALKQIIDGAVNASENS